MYKTLESSIRNVMREASMKNMRMGSKESDQNDQVAVGSYVTKSFEMDPDAQILYTHLPKDTDANAAEKAAIYLDKLFAIHKHVLNTGMASTADIKSSEEFADVILKAAQDMNQEEAVTKIVSAHLKSINSKYKEHERIIHPDDHLHPSDDPRFGTAPKGNEPDPIPGPQGDRDHDNTKSYLIKRMKAAQRKIKVIDAD